MAVTILGHLQGLQICQGGMGSIQIDRKGFVSGGGPRPAQVSAGCSATSEGGGRLALQAIRSEHSAKRPGQASREKMNSWWNSRVK